jgi:hypothetical protein
MKNKAGIVVTVVVLSFIVVGVYLITIIANG